MKTYDVIVLGLGGVGSAAAFHLCQRDLRVLALDRFEPGHDRGSSHGHTRIIRKAYFEHPDYVPLLDRAYQLWHELEIACGRQLYYPVGLLEVGPPDGVVYPGVLASARQHDLAIETVSATECAERFPGFVIPAGSKAVFERDAGYLLVEACVQAHADLARAAGAELETSTEVIGWRREGNGVAVETSTGTYAAAALVIAAGPWSDRLLQPFPLPLRVVRKHLHWFASKTDQYDAHRGCPGFFYETPAGYFYGFPAVDARGVKVAEHSGGERLDDPLNASRAIDPQDRTRVSEFLQEHLPGVSREATEHAVCFYTLSPDEHFVVDRHPGFPQVCLAAGLSGHGFKFTSVLGEILAELVIDGRSQLPIEFLACGR